MTQNKHQHNNLDLYRRRMRFSAREVSQLLGHAHTSAWSNYERGKRLPSLANALKLGIILRTPVEFLFHGLHDQLHAQIRADEERQRTAAPQQMLF